MIITLKTSSVRLCAAKFAFFSQIIIFLIFGVFFLKKKENFNTFSLINTHMKNDENNQNDYSVLRRHE